MNEDTSTGQEAPRRGSVPPSGSQHPPRPKVDDTMKRQAAAEIVKELVRDGLHEDDPQSIVASVAAVAKHGRQWIDGYELAKALDDYHRWQPGADVVEVLDGYGYALRAVHTRAMEQWVEAHGIAPTIAIGTRVRLLSSRRAETGTITDVSQHEPAAYLVAIDDDEAAAAPTNSRRIVWFEDAEAL